MGSPVGEFGRGRDDENQVQVTLTHDFALEQHELTQHEWTTNGFSNLSDSTFDEAGSPADCIADTCPASRMTWYQAAVYANHLSNAHGLQSCYVLSGCASAFDAGWADASTRAYVCKDVASSTLSLYDCDGYRLPTEAEWEYAARAGTTTAFYSGAIKAQGNWADCNDDPNLLPIAWYCKNSGNMTHPCAQKAPNQYGLYDMLGNAAEWVNDKYNGAGYGKGPLVDPWSLLEFGVDVLARGGVVSTWASEERCAGRGPVPWGASGQAGGFRLARTLKPGITLNELPDFRLADGG